MAVAVVNGSGSGSVAWMGGGCGWGECGFVSKSVGEEVIIFFCQSMRATLAVQPHYQGPIHPIPNLPPLKMTALTPPIQPTHCHTATATR
jgi:hypothetical protein